MRVAYLITAPIGAWTFLRGQLGYMRQRGHEVRLYSGPGEYLERTALSEGVEAEALPFEREIALWSDVRALVGAWRALRRFRPDVVSVGTPKAGLLGGLAAVLAGVPARIYILHGLRLETTRGAKRLVLTAAERLACACAHRVVCVSPSLRARALELGLLSPAKALLIESGTANGVDVAHFRGDATRARGAAVRERFGIPSGAPVVGFVGRFTRDKGLHELLEAFALVQAELPSAHLLLVGDFEEGDPVTPEVSQRIRAGRGVVCTGFVDDAAPYYHAMNVLALPTYREGFPTVVLEAAAAGLPTVTTHATGARDAVSDGVTGLMVPVGDSAALARALLELLKDPERARAMGRAGGARVEQEFIPERIWGALERLYAGVLEEQRSHRGAT